MGKGSNPSFVNTVWTQSLVKRPLATLETPGAFLNGLRWMGIDGTVFDLRDTEENARVCRAVPLFQQSLVSQSEGDGNSTVTLFVSWLMEEILEQEIPPRQGRTNPRVVKKPRSKFPSRKRTHR